MTGGVIAIVIVAIVANMIVRLVRIGKGLEAADRRGGGNALPAAGPNPREAELTREVEDLRERIKVLERIATDAHKPQALAAEIESLRSS